MGKGVGQEERGDMWNQERERERGRERERAESGLRLVVVVGHSGPRWVTAGHSGPQWVRVGEAEEQRPGGKHPLLAPGSAGASSAVAARKLWSPTAIVGLGELAANDRG